MSKEISKEQSNVAGWMVLGTYGLVLLLPFVWLGFLIWAGYMVVTWLVSK